MEYEELEKLWNKYDSKLDNLEKMNKKLIRDSLLKKPTRKLNWHKFNSIYGLIALPIILFVALYPNFTKENLDLKLIIGCILCLLVIAYISILNIKSFRILNTIRLEKDSILVSANKIVEFKKLINSRVKHAFVYYPIITLGVLLIAWDSFFFDTKTIVFLVVIFLITYGGKPILKNVY